MAGDGMGQGWEVMVGGNGVGGQMKEMLEVADKAAQEERKKTEGEVGNGWALLGWEGWRQAGAVGVWVVMVLCFWVWVSVRGDGDGG